MVDFPPEFLSSGCLVPERSLQCPETCLGHPFLLDLKIHVCFPALGPGVLLSLSRVQTTIPACSLDYFHERDGQQGPEH